MNNKRGCNGEDIKSKALKNTVVITKNIIIIIVVYYVIYFCCSSPLFPPLTSVLKSIFSIMTEEQFIENMASTMKILGCGIAVSFVVGNTISILCHLFSCVDLIVMPVVNFIKNIPSITMFPVFVVLMGIGDMPRVTVIIWNSLYAIVTTGSNGIQNTDKDTIEAAQNAGASKWQICLHIRIPLAFMDILQGLKISLSNGFIAIVVAEMLGATKGIGYMIIWSANAFEYSDMYAYIIIIAVVGYCLNTILEYMIHKIERRIYE